MVLVSVFIQDGIVGLRKAQTRYTPSHRAPPLPPKSCLQNSTKVGLVEHISFLTSEGGTSVMFFVYLSFLHSGLSMFRKFLKPLSTSTLPSCRLAVLSIMSAFLSACSLNIMPGTRQGKTKTGLSLRHLPIDRCVV